MIGALRTPEQQTVTVFGGSGFLGRYVVSRLAERGYRILVPTRQPNLANFLPLGKVGQINPIHANLRNEDSVAHAVARADHVINLVGILQETGRQRFDTLQAQAPAMIARLARKAATFTHISAIGADANSESAYARTKAEGEARVFAARPDAVVLRPSLVFGMEDQFFNRFANMARLSPVLPLIGGGKTRFQPVFVNDVALAVADAVEGKVAGGRVYELGGPSVLTFREMMEEMLRVVERRRRFVDISFGTAASLANLLGKLPGAPLTPDQVRRLRDDHAIYMADNGRANLVGIADADLDRFCAAIVEALNG